jgi:FtsH-binding integral membrane protein
MPYLFGALWVLIIFGFMAAFFPKSSAVELGYGVVAALIFSGYILVDTQLVMRHYHVVRSSLNPWSKEYETSILTDLCVSKLQEEEIAASISLYLDILNLFLAILRILNSQQNN